MRARQGAQHSTAKRLLLLLMLLPMGVPLPTAPPSIAPVQYTSSSTPHPHAYGMVTESHKARGRLIQRVLYSLARLQPGRPGCRHAMAFKCTCVVMMSAFLC